MLYPFFTKEYQGIPKTKIKNVDLTTFYQGIMEPVGVEPTSKHLPTYLSTTIGYVFV